MAQLKWELLHPKMTLAHLGYIPIFIDDKSPFSAKEQINTNYVSGWIPFKGFKLTEENHLTYPGDPILKPLAKAQLRDEVIYFYDSSWVCIVEPDGSYEVARLD
jgi:hypothetical protein